MIISFEIGTNKKKELEVFGVIIKIFIKPINSLFISGFTIIYVSQP